MSSESEGSRPLLSLRLGARSLARFGAIQALYQMDVAGVDVDSAIACFELGGLSLDSNEMLPKDVMPDIAFLEDMVRGVLNQQKVLDPVIGSHLAEGWRLSRIDATLRAILRAGAYELCYRKDIPSRVVIHEYVELAHDFFSFKEVSVVNAVLDRIAALFRVEEAAS